jgi:general secretion pathway protein K
MKAGSHNGIALVLTLMVLAIITAVVVEFAYGVYVNTNFLANWQTSQKLSLTAKSGVTLASRLINYALEQNSYTYPGSVYLPPADPFSSDKNTGSNLRVSITIEDETSKFNLNSLVYSNNKLNEDAYESFVRLLKYLSLDTDIADRIADWIDKDQTPRTQGSEEGAKNASMESTDELLLIPGINREIYDKLMPYVTAYGKRGIINININGADIPVLMSLSKDINEDMAKRVIRYREVKPFEHPSHLQKVAGFETLATSLMGRITVKGEFFRIISTAFSEDGIKRIIECVIDSSGQVKYWKEV